MSEIELQSLVNDLENLANEMTDGHITILKFTTGWKAALGTPNLDIGDGRDKISNLKNHSSFKEAVKDLIANKTSLHD